MERQIVWQDGQASAAQHATLLGQQAVTLWLTGLSASGKSILAYALEQQLHGLGRACYVLDGDNVRHGLNRDLGFSEQDRAETSRRIAEVARLMNQAGLIVITAFISRSRADRAMARDIIGADNFREVSVSTSLAVCEARDPKGLYLKARSGQLAGCTGVSSPYEASESPALSIDTAQVPVDVAVRQMMQLIGMSPAT
ncbi:adenylyl-sulfate kinase [Actimicrobium antarcticum]|uniref:Adenylyl-sulfate kinase n=1 Tax=Actimicrobium antarcticum TaxID=1051899 RepID=A0ABP7TPA0_9BURK